MLIVAIGVTAGTADKASQKGGLYVLYLGKILIIDPKICEDSVHQNFYVLFIKLVYLSFIFQDCLP